MHTRAKMSCCTLKFDLTISQNVASSKNWAFHKQIFWVRKHVKALEDDVKVCRLCETNLNYFMKSIFNFVLDVL